MIFIPSFTKGNKAWVTPAGTFDAEFYTARQGHDKALEASQDSVSIQEFTTQNILKGYFKICILKDACKAKNDTIEREREKEREIVLRIIKSKVRISRVLCNMGLFWFSGK